MAGRGRFKTLTGDSREECRCPVCPEKGRLDNLKNRHVLKVIIWSSEDNNLPAKESEDKYKAGSKEQKEHTDYWRVNNYTRTRFPTFKRVIQGSSATGTVDSYFKRPKPNNNNNPGAAASNSNQATEVNVEVNCGLCETSNKQSQMCHLQETSMQHYSLSPPQW